MKRQQGWSGAFLFWTSLTRLTARSIRSSAISLGLLILLLPGCERREIIRPTPHMDIAPQFWVRVRLQAGISECEVRIPSTFHVARADLGPGSGHPTREPLQEATTITLVGGQLMLGAIPLGGPEVTIHPGSPHVFTFNGQDFRGRLRLVVNRDGQTFDAINVVPLEPYLAGVVGEEMPRYWEPQALRVQAIAARTYCLFIRNRFGVNRNYDVSRTQASQVYGGVGAECIQTWKAVNSTAGMVLMTNPPQAGQGTDLLARGLFPTYFSAVCGGHTSNSEEVFGDSFEPLGGVPCPHCQDVARVGVFFWPMAQFDRKTVTEQLLGRYPSLKALGEIKDIIVTERRDHGQFSRLTTVKLVGTTGKSDTLRAESLRLGIDPTGRQIKSTICHVLPWGDGWAFLSGRGWGHGVGLCQTGAEGMARKGSSAEEILQYYYPGARIVSLY